MRWIPSQCKRNSLSASYREFTDRGEVPKMHGNRGLKLKRIRTSDRAYRVIVSRYPRHDMAVIEPDGQIHPHRHRASQNANDSNDVGTLSTPRNRHKVDHLDRSTLRYELAFENQRSAAIVAADTLHRRVGRDLPMSICGAAEQSSETGTGIKSWYAQPIDRPVVSDQRDRVCVSNNRVVFNFVAHSGVFVASGFAEFSGTVRFAHHNPRRSTATSDQRDRSQTRAPLRSRSPVGAPTGIHCPAH